MKETLKVTSVLCGILAVISVVTGFRALTGHGWYIGLSMFSMVRKGTAMGFMGNLLSIALTAAGFGSMAFLGFTSNGNAQKSRKAFVWGYYDGSVSDFPDMQHFYEKFYIGRRYYACAARTVYILRSEMRVKSAASFP